jgi:hypothetical protein
MVIVAIGAVLIALCLVAAFFVLGRSDPILLWAGLAMGFEGGSGLTASPLANILNMAALAAAVCFVAAYTLHVRRRMAEMQLESAMREQQFLEQIRDMAATEPKAIQAGLRDVAAGDAGAPDEPSMPTENPHSTNQDPK